MNDIFEAKERLKGIYDIFDIVESENNLPNEIYELGTDLKGVFRMEFISYLLYLVASDGKILPIERDFINTLFDLSMKIQDYVNLINENNIYSYEFEDKFPVSLHSAILFDAKVVKLSEVADVAIEMIGPRLLNFYLEIGEVLIRCDGEIHQNEIENLKNYISRLEQKSNELFLEYVREIEISPKSDIGYIGPKKRKKR